MNPQEYLPRLAMTLNNVARLYRDMDRLVDCEANCREAQAILQPFWENSPRLYGDLMSAIYLNLGWTLG